MFGSIASTILHLDIRLVFITTRLKDRTHTSVIFTTSLMTHLDLNLPVLDPLFLNVSVCECPEIL